MTALQGIRPDFSVFPKFLHLLHQSNSSTLYIVLVYGLLVICALLLSIFWVRPSALFRRASAKRVLKRLKNIPHAGQQLLYLRKIDPFTFEELLLTAFETRGVKIRRNHRYTGDGGIDGKIRIEHDWILIQAKRYSKSINPQHVSDFAELCYRKRCKGLFIHTGRTGDASRMNAGREVQFISGSQLLNLLHGNEIQIFTYLLFKQIIQG